MKTFSSLAIFLSVFLPESGNIRKFMSNPVHYPEIENKIILSLDAGILHDIWQKAYKSIEIYLRIYWKIEKRECTELNWGILRVWNMEYKI